MESLATEIRETHFMFPSSLKGEQAARIHALQWLPPANVALRAVVHITHGMSEHIERYDHFARFLAERGFAVCGQDNIGHGKSVASNDDWGHIPVEGGKDALIENVHVLRGIVEKRMDSYVGEKACDRLPYFMFGHSMGSFILRDYLSRHGQGLAGAVICGTGRQSAAVAAAGLAAARAIARVKGERFVSDALFNLADGAYGKAIKHARTDLDWLAANPAVVDAYLADPACGFRFSAGAYVALMGLLLDVSKKSVIDRIPKTLPLFLIAGSEDPVGARGRGVARVYQEYKQAGLHDVDMRLYLGMRHEIINEKENGKVYGDVLQWLEGHIR